MFFTCVTVTLTRWPSYKNLTPITWRCTGCAKMNFLHQGFQKLLTEIMYHSTSRVVNNKAMKRNVFFITSKTLQPLVYKSMWIVEWWSNKQWSNCSHTCVNDIKKYANLCPHNPLHKCNTNSTSHNALHNYTPVYKSKVHSGHQMKSILPFFSTLCSLYLATDLTDQAVRLWQFS